MTVPMEKRIKRATLSVVKNLPSFIIFAISVAAARYVATTRRAATYVTDGV